MNFTRAETLFRQIDTDRSGALSAAELIDYKKRALKLVKSVAEQIKRDPESDRSKQLKNELEKTTITVQIIDVAMCVAARGCEDTDLSAVVEWAGHFANIFDLQNLDKLVETSDKLLQVVEAGKSLSASGSSDDDLIPIPTLRADVTLPDWNKAISAVFIKAERKLLCNVLGIML